MLSSWPQLSGFYCVMLSSPLTDPSLPLQRHWDMFDPSSVVSGLIANADSPHDAAILKQKREEAEEARLDEDVGQLHTDSLEQVSAFRIHPALVWRFILHLCRFFCECIHGSDH
jgi:hypothetical protein